MTAFLRGVEHYLPSTICTNEDLAAANPTWIASDIYERTGIRTRHVAAPGETASDLGYAAAERLFVKAAFPKDEIDVLLFCTQSADYLLPTTACTLQERLALRTSCAALDYNLGCSGFTYGLWLARALVAAEDARNVLLIVADTSSHYCDRNDAATATIFGDAGAAAIISRYENGSMARIGPSVLGTDGRGKKHLIVPSGGARMRDAQSPRDRCMSMNGPAIAAFTLSSVRRAVLQLIERQKYNLNDIDWFLFHQANAVLLDRLRIAMGIPQSKMPILMADTGNLGSASIPVLLCRLIEAGQLQANQRCILAGFGVGFSWAITEITWGV